MLFNYCLPSFRKFITKSGCKRKHLVYSIVIILVLSCNSVHRMYVNFGTFKDEKSKLVDTTIRIYFDRKGFVYPNSPIDDHILRKSDSRLGCYYENYKNFYNNICASYSIKPDTGDLNLIKPYADHLQEAIINDYAKQINNLSTDRRVIFIIHGFNESPLDNSALENKTTADSIKQIYNNKVFLFVDIYWDGLSAAQGISFLKPFNSLHIWPYAQVSATYVGMELRRLLSQLSAKDIGVLTHSHGAGVITTALFNVEKFNDSYYSDSCSWLYEIKNRYKNTVYNSPNQQYYVGMLAPAIPGYNVFRKYYSRTVNGKEQTSANKNFHFVVGFNKNDQVTTKYSFAAKHIGSTSLACIPNELITTMALFNNDSTIITYEDFSNFSNNHRQTQHSWLVYLNNQPHFSNFLSKMFTNENK